MPSTSQTAASLRMQPRDQISDVPTAVRLGVNGLESKIAASGAASQLAQTYKADMKRRLTICQSTKGVPIPVFGSLWTEMKKTKVSELCLVCIRRVLDRS